MSATKMASPLISKTEELKYRAVIGADVKESLEQKVRIPVDIEVEELGVLEGELIRFYAPLTVREILKMMPLEGFLAKWDYAVYFQIELRRGAEKTVQKASGGDVLYWPPGPYIVLAFQESVAPAQTVKIGRVERGYETLSRAKAGSRIRIAVSKKVT